MSWPQNVRDQAGSRTTVENRVITIYAWSRLAAIRNMSFGMKLWRKRGISTQRKDTQRKDTQRSGMRTLLKERKRLPIKGFSLDTSGQTCDNTFWIGRLINQATNKPLSITPNWKRPSEVVSWCVIRSTVSRTNSTNGETLSVMSSAMLSTVSGSSVSDRFGLLDIHPFGLLRFSKFSNPLEFLEKNYLQHSNNKENQAKKPKCIVVFNARHPTDVYAQQSS